MLLNANCRPHRANLLDGLLFVKIIISMEFPICSVTSSLYEPNRVYLGHSRRMIFWKLTTSTKSSSWGVWWDHSSSLTPCLKGDQRSCPSGETIPRIWFFKGNAFFIRFLSYTQIIFFFFSLVPKCSIHWIFSAKHA